MGIKRLRNALSGSMRAVILAGSMLTASQAMSQIMISYDGNENRDMVTSIKSVSEDGIYTSDFDYNDNRSLKALNFKLVFTDETAPETASGVFEYTWDSNSLNVSASANGFFMGTFVLPLNNQHNLTNSNGFGDTPYTFQYEDNGYLASFTEENDRGILKWENSNLTEYTCDGYTRSFSYGGVENTTNIDFGITGFANDLGIMCLPLGKWSKDLPDYIKEIEDGQLIYEANLTYEKDEKGRISKITVDETEYENGVIDEKYVASMEISYSGNFDSAVESIEAISLTENIYDIMGHKLSSPTRGLNIINGKKVLVR